jgi:hypothetical protein
MQTFRKDYFEIFDLILYGPYVVEMNASILKYDFLYDERICDWYSSHIAVKAITVPLHAMER